MPLLELPQSKLGMEVPLTAYRLAVSGYPHSARGLLPDYSITYSIDDLLAGRDKELDTAIELVRMADDL